MVYGKAEDAGGLSPAKDDNAAVRHFIISESIIRK